MTDSEANEIRLTANKIMQRLFEAGQREQLDLLRKYAIRAIGEIDKKAGPYGCRCQTFHHHVAGSGCELCN